MISLHNSIVSVLICPTPSDYMCLNGNCVSGQARCNVALDCPDFSDETSCPLPCQNGMFQCTSILQCISSLLVCDGTNHCNDGSDEGLVCKFFSIGFFLDFKKMPQLNKVCILNREFCMHETVADLFRGRDGKSISPHMKVHVFFKFNNSFIYSWFNTILDLETKTELFTIFKQFKKYIGNNIANGKNHTNITANK